MPAESCGVKVLCRFRPFNSREKEEFAGKESEMKLKFNGATINLELGFNKHEFTFDMCFEPDAPQDSMFEYMKDSLKDIEDGYNGTIFAYGQTGSGKTYSMFGPDGYDKFPEQWGVVPRACTRVFEMINAAEEQGIEYSITGSFLEVYNEAIRDLVDPRKDNLMVREHPAKGIYVEDLSEEYLASPEDVWALIALGDANKAKAATSMNARSSRSHTVFILRLHQKLKDGTTKTGKLNLVDLAGSEKVGKTGASGEVLEQAKNINKSLSALGNCINALTAGKKVHVPYRDSKLTRILQESLGGNSKTTLIVCASPHEFNFEETLGTLRFAQRAKMIKNKIKANVLRSAEELEKLLNALRNEYAKLQRYCKGLEETVEWMKKNPGKECPIVVEKPDEQGAQAMDKPFKEPKAEGAEGEEEDEEDDSYSVAESEMSIAEGEYDPVASAERRLDSAKAKRLDSDVVTHLRSEVSRRQEKENELQAQLAQLNKDLASSNATMEALKEELTRERDEWKADKARVDFVVKQKTMEAEAATEDKDRLVKQVEELQTAVQEAKASGGNPEQIQVYKKQVSEAMARNTELQAKLDAQAEAQADLDQECADLHELIGMLEDDAETARTEADEANEKVEGLETQVKDQTAKYQAASSELEGAKSTLAETKTQLDTAQRELASALEREKAGGAAGDATSLAQERDSLKAQLESAAAAKAEVTQRHAEAVKKAEDAAASEAAAAEGLKKLTTELETEKAEKHKLELQTVADQTRLSVSEKQREELQNQIKEMRGVEEELRRKLQETEERAAGVGSSEQLKEAMQTSSTLQQENLNLKRDLETKASKCLSLLRQMEQQTERLLELEQSQANSRKDAKAMRDEIEAAKASAKEAQEAIAERDGRIEEMQEQMHDLPLIRRAKIFRPVRSSTALGTALATKEDISALPGRLRKTGILP